ncbi:MAG: hypothetical protein RRA92_10720 [Gemmatimonadota bacterium]|nr:hypothetical protein [Gemmatimonadota bacterium]
MNAIPDVSFEGDFPAVAPSGTASYGVLSDDSRVALDSLVVSVNGERTVRLLEVNGDWTAPEVAAALLREGSNTGSVTCYASWDGTGRAASDNESFRLTRIVPPLPTIGVLPAVDAVEDQLAAVSTAGLVTDGELTAVTVTTGSVTAEYRSAVDSLYVTPAPDWNGQYVLQFEAGNAQGLTTKDGTYTVTPQPDLLAGQLQDNETDTGKSGQLELLIDGTPIRTINTDGSGNWEKQNLPEGSQLTIKAQLDEGSYIRTVRADISNNGDVNIPIVRAVPYAGLSANGISVQDFKAHIYSIKGGADITTRFDIENFKKSCYFFDNPESTDSGSFTQDQINSIIDAWESSDRIPKLIENKVFIIEECKDNDWEIDPSSGFAVPKKGILLWVPDYNLPAQGFGVAFDVNSDGGFDSGYIRINPNFSANLTDLKRTAAHEAGHAIQSWVHPDVLPNSKTIMAIPVTPEKPQFADEKAAKIMLDTTFKDGEDLEDILGL